MLLYQELLKLILYINMANSIALSLSQSKETFKQFRLFLISKGFSKEQVLQLEEMKEDAYIPRCVKFIEHLGIDFNEAVNYYVWERPDLTYWELLPVTIVGVFRKIENNDVNFNNF